MSAGRGVLPVLMSALGQALVLGQMLVLGQVLVLAAALPYGLHMASRVSGVIDELQRTVAEASSQGFDRQHGALAAALLPHLPQMLQVLRRVPFDLSLPQRMRHRAAAAALYILDADDFIAGDTSEARSLVDDVWVAAATLASIADALDDDSALARHWRGATPFAEVLGLAHNAQSLADRMPPKILEVIRSFLLEA